MMAFFVFTYDLRKKKEEDYQELWDTVKEHDSVKFQKSAYYISSALTQTQLYAALLKHVHEDDLISVVNFVAKPTWNKALPGTAAWIKKHWPNT